jgi:hypothetical protein
MSPTFRPPKSFVLLEFFAFYPLISFFDSQAHALQSSGGRRFFMHVCICIDGSLDTLFGVWDCRISSEDAFIDGLREREAKCLALCYGLEHARR